MDKWLDLNKNKWLDLYIPNNDSELKFRGYVSIPLVYYGLQEILFIIPHKKIKFKYKSMLLLGLICSTISDGFFLINYITFLDRYINIIVFIQTIYLTINKQKIVSFCDVFELSIGILCLCKARSSKSYYTWHMYHSMWHLNVFKVLRGMVNKGVFN